MALTSFIDPTLLKTYIGARLTESIKLAAEPILQKALKDMEKVMREKLATTIISMIDQEFDVARMGQDIRILIRHNKEMR